MITDSINIMDLSQDEFQEIIDKILNIIQSEITDDVLTIKPVMDYSEIIEGTSLIAGMLSRFIAEFVIYYVIYNKKSELFYIFKHI